MKKSLKKMLVLVGLMGMPILSVSAMQVGNDNKNSSGININKNINRNEKFVNFREDVELPHENDKIIRLEDKSYVTPLEFIENYLNKGNLVYDMTEGCFFEKLEVKEKFITKLDKAKYYVFWVLQDIIDEYLKTNIKNYEETLIKKIRKGILRNLKINDHIFYKDKNFLKNEILLEKEFFNDYMEILEDIVENVGRNNNDYEFDKLEQEYKDVYKLFLIVRQFIEIFNHNPMDFIKNNVIRRTCSKFAEKDYLKKWNLKETSKPGSIKEEKEKEKFIFDYENRFSELHGRKQKIRNKEKSNILLLNEEKKIANDILESEEFSKNCLQTINKQEYAIKNKKNIIENLRKLYIDFKKTFDTLNDSILKEDDKLFYHNKEVFEYYKEKYRKNYSDDFSYEERELKKQINDKIKVIEEKIKKEEDRKKDNTLEELYKESCEILKNINYDFYNKINLEEFKIKYESYLDYRNKEKYDFGFNKYEQNLIEKINSKIKNVERKLYIKENKNIEFFEKIDNKLLDIIRNRDLYADEKECEKLKKECDEIKKEFKTYLSMNKNNGYSDSEKIKLHKIDVKFNSMKKFFENNKKNKKLKLFNDDFEKILNKINFDIDDENKENIKNEFENLNKEYNEYLDKRDANEISEDEQNLILKISDKIEAIEKKLEK